jgi:hypothetical protein
MMDSTNDLSFTDCTGGKRVGTGSTGGGLLNESAKDIILPETYLGTKVVEIGNSAFRSTSIVSIFISRYVKSIRHAAFWECYSLIYMTFDDNSELEIFDPHLVSNTKIESLNLPPLLKTFGGAVAFVSNSKLSCASYFGSNDITTSYLFSGVSSSFIAHSSPEYQYKIGTYTPVKDRVKCPEKKYNTKKQERTCVCTCNCMKYSTSIKSEAILITLLLSS